MYHILPVSATVAINKPRIRTVFDKGIIRLDLFEGSLADETHEYIRFIIRGNPYVPVTD